MPYLVGGGSGAAASTTLATTARTRPARWPLSAAAVVVLAWAYTLATGAAAEPEDVPRLAALMGPALIFPSAKRTTPLSDIALSVVVRMTVCPPLGRVARPTMGG